MTIIQANLLGRISTLLFFVDKIEDVVDDEGDCENDVEFDAIVVYDFRPAPLRFSLFHQNINRVRELFEPF